MMWRTDKGSKANLTLVAAIYEKGLHVRLRY